MSSRSVASTWSSAVHASRSDGERPASCAAPEMVSGSSSSCRRSCARAGCEATSARPRGRAPGLGREALLLVLLGALGEAHHAEPPFDRVAAGIVCLWQAPGTAGVASARARALAHPARPVLRARGGQGHEPVRCLGIGQRVAAGRLLGRGGDFLPEGGGWPSLPASRDRASRGQLMTWTRRYLAGTCACSLALSRTRCVVIVEWRSCALQGG